MEDRYCRDQIHKCAYGDSFWSKDSSELSASTVTVCGAQQFTAGYNVTNLFRRQLMDRILRLRVAQLRSPGDLYFVDDLLSSLVGY